MQHPFICGELDPKPVRDLLLEYKADVVEEEVVDEEAEVSLLASLFKRLMFKFEMGLKFNYKGIVHHKCPSHCKKALFSPYSPENLYDIGLYIMPYDRSCEYHKLKFVNYLEAHICRTHSIYGSNVRNPFKHVFALFTLFEVDLNYVLIPPLLSVYSFDQEVIVR